MGRAKEDYNLQTAAHYGIVQMLSKHVDILKREIELLKIRIENLESK